MALHVHQLDTKEFLFEIADEWQKHLDPVFKQFRYRTGIEIDPYGNTPLTVENGLTLIRVIDDYVQKTDLNQNKPAITRILSLRGLLEYFTRRSIDFLLIGD